MGSTEVSQPFMLASYAEILLQTAEEKGVPGARLLAHAGLPRDLMVDPDAALSNAQFAALVEAALARTDDGSLGLVFGQRLKFTTHGALAQAAVSSDTLEDALDVLMRYYRTRFPGVELQLRRQDDWAALELAPRLASVTVERFMVEALFVSMMEVNQLLFGTELLKGGSARLSYPAPAHRAAYEPIFHEAVYFSQPFHQLRFRDECLSLPMTLANPVVRRQAERQCEEQLAATLRRDDVVRQVRRLMAREDGIPDMAEAAARLCVTVRTLHRRLAAYGLGYQDLVNEARRERACRLLRESRRSVEDIAAALGYQDPSNFGRAFRRWLGCSPSAYRNRR